MNSIYAVLTGDLISSRDHSAAQVDAALNCLREASERIPRHHPDFSPRFTRHRGDGWQMICLPRHALTACLVLMAALRAADIGLKTRVAVGVGPMPPLSTEDLSAAHGRAFEISGDLLDKLSRQRGPETIMIDGDGNYLWQKGIFSLTDWIVQGWTAQQAEAVLLALTDILTNAERARSLGISRQAFEARLKGSGLDSMERARSAFLEWDPEKAITC